MSGYELTSDYFVVRVVVWVGTSWHQIILWYELWYEWVRVDIRLYCGTSCGMSRYELTSDYIVVRVVVWVGTSWHQIILLYELWYEWVRVDISLYCCTSCGMSGYELTSDYIVVRVVVWVGTSWHQIILSYELPSDYCVGWIDMSCGMSGHELISDNSTRWSRTDWEWYELTWVRVDMGTSWLVFWRLKTIPALKKIKIFITAVDP